MLAFAAGCAAPLPSEPPVAGRVVFFRGAGELFSNGLDRMADALRNRGINATVEGSLGDVTLTTADKPIVLGGHSIGADAAVRIATDLAAEKVPVALLVLIDPFDPPPIPANVGFLFVVTGREMKLDVPRGVRMSQYRVESNLPLLGGLLNQIGHLSITDNAAAQEAILRRTLKVFGKSEKR